MTLHLSEVTNACQQAEGYPDQSHYLFHLFPLKIIRRSTKKSLLKTTLKAEQIKTSASLKRPIFLYSPWYRQV